MKKFLVLSAILFSMSAHANPFDYFAGNYTVVSPIAVTNWNFASCNLWNLPNSKAVSVAADPANNGAYMLSVDTGRGLQAVESLGDFSCGGQCYYRTSSRSTPTMEASSAYVPNGYNSQTSRGVIMNQTDAGFELFIADVTYDLPSEGHQRNGYCFYEMKLKKN